MNATSREEIRSSGAARETSDPQMDQIRELLVGDIVRQGEARLATLELRIRNLESVVTARLDELSARIDALAGATDDKHRAAFEELARGVAALSDSIGRVKRD